VVIVIKVEEGDERGPDSRAEGLAKELRDRFPISVVPRIDVEYSARTVIKF
jgi:hypothetical protein